VARLAREIQLDPDSWATGFGRETHTTTSMQWIWAALQKAAVLELSHNTLLVSGPFAQGEASLTEGESSRPSFGT